MSNRVLDRVRSLALGVDLLLLAALLAHIGVFAHLQLFAHPTGDDFTLGVDARADGLWAVNAHYYWTWTGRYFGMAMVTAAAVLFEFTRDYWWLLSLNNLWFLGCAVAFVGALLPVGSAWWRRLAGGLAFTAVFLETVITPNQTFYWYTGQAFYTVGMGAVLALTALLLRPSLSMRATAAAVVLVTVAAGSNEPLMVLTATLTLARFGWACWTARETCSNWATPMLAALVCGAIVFLSPGNDTRERQGLPMPTSLSVRLRYTYSHGLEELQKHNSRRFALMNWLAFLAAVAWFAAAQSASGASDTGSDVRQRAAMLLGLLGVWGLLLGAQHFLPYWAMQKKLYVRTINQADWWFLWGCAVFAAGIGRELGRRVPHRGPVWGWLGRALTCAWLALIVQHGAARTAWGEIPEARVFSAAMNMRYRVIQRLGELNISEVRVDPIDAHPSTIFFWGMGSDPNDWDNRGRARYFGVKSLAIRAR